MAYKPVKLADSVRITCNQCLEDLQGLQQDIGKAEQAKIAGTDALGQRCQECIDKVIAIKAVYFPNKK